MTLMLEVMMEGTLLEGCEASAGMVGTEGAVGMLGRGAQRDSLLCIARCEPI